MFDLTLHLNDSVQVFSFEEGMLTLGRDPSCEVVVEDDGIALHHAMLWLEGDKVQVEDLAGNHDTLVNGYDISGRVEVACPASVQIGPAVVVIKIRGESDASQRDASAAADMPSGTAEEAVPDPSFGLGPRSATVQVQYTLGPEIARGGMGRIHRGEDPHLKREVAIKISSMGGDPRFSREAEVLGNLPHPNIIPIHAIGEDEDGFPFYSMKLVKGQTLQAVIKQLREGDAETKKYYSRERLLTIFRKICDAMAFAHSKGILHRDLKPENVMVGEFGEVLVMDWGLAKRLGEKESLADGSLGLDRLPSPPSDDYGATMDGEVLGTPQYMSPEQAQGRLAELDERSDIYALGAILYSILTLRPPVEGDSLDELLTKVRSGQITSMVTKRSRVAEGKTTAQKPAEMGMQVPEALRAVTRKAMALERENRYQSVEEFSTDIESYMHGFATSAEHAGILRQLFLMMRRHKAVTVLLFFMAAGAFAFTLKLIASERIATRNAQIAEENARAAVENEKKAAEEREHARRIAADAHLALVEAAERDLDGEEIQRTLAEVPKDLRDQRWEYLNAKLEASDMTAVAKDNAGWIALSPHPQKPGVLFTLQTNGWIRTLDLKKQGGAIGDICRYDTSNLIDIFEVSKDATKAAVVRYQRDKGMIKATSIEVLQLPSGKKVSEIKLPPIGWIQIVFSPDGASLSCIFKTIGGNQQKHELRTLQGEVLWEKVNEGGLWVDFSEDGKKIQGLSDRNGFVEFDSKTGDVLGTPVKIPWANTMVGQGGAGKMTVHLAANANWSSIVAFNGSPRFLRRYDTTSGKVLFENRCLPITALAALPNSDLLATLSQRSDRCVVLQYWHRDTGLLIKSMPLLGNLKGGWRMAVHPKTGDVAVINGNKLRAWNFQTSKAVKKFDANARSFDFAGEPWRIARVTGQRQDAALEILDTRIAGFDKKPLASIKDAAIGGAQLSSSKDGTVIALNQGGNTHIYRRKDAALSESFTGNSIQRYGPHWTLNSSGTRLWTGFGVYDTTNGKEICKMERNGVDVPPNAAGLSDWVNASTIVEIALVKADWPGAPEDAVERAMLLWNAETGKQILKVDAPDANGLCISPDGRQICEAGNDMRLRLRNGQTLEVEKEFRAHDGAITDVECHPKLPLLISSSEDLNVRIWNVKDGRLVEELHGIASQLDQRTERVAVSPEGSLLALKAGGGQVGIYEPESFKSPQRPPSAAPPAQPKPNPAQGAPQAPAANTPKPNPAPPQKPGAVSPPPNPPVKSVQ